VTPYYALLTELRGQVPALEGQTMLGADGRRVTRNRLSPRARQLWRDYRLVQYDLSVGQRYAARALLTRP
jgi:hypothetical protein